MISLLITDCTLASDDMTIPEKTKHTEKLYAKLSKCINSDNNFPSLDTAISLDIDPSHEINAFSSQGKIVITAGLLKIANSDEFIAFVYFDSTRLKTTVVKTLDLAVGARSSKCSCRRFNFYPGVGG